ADADMAKRIEANLYKLVNCLWVDDITEQDAISRVLALVKVRSTPEQRAEVLTILEVFRARALDVGPESLVVEVSGTQGKVQGLITALSPYGIVETVQTGTIAMTRGLSDSAGFPPSLVAATPTRAA